MAPLARHYNAKQVANITYAIAIATANAWNRVAMGFRKAPEPPGWVTSLRMSKTVPTPTQLQFRRIGALRIGLALALCALLAAPQSFASGFTEIEIRQDRDGAGPSHIFHLHDNMVAVVDPLDGAISAYRVTQGVAVKTALMPAGFRPWRLVRQPASVAIISEDGKQRIEVGRDEADWPREFAAAAHDAKDAAYRIPPVVRTRSGLTLKTFRGERALAIRAVGPYYLASARELERIGDGRRYVLWKEHYLSEPPPDQPDEQTIRVNAYVGRFEKDRSLSGIAPLPLAAMSRIGFDYATIMPDGTIALLASLVSSDAPGPFKIYRLTFQTPSRYLAKLQRTAGRPRHWARPPPLSDMFPLIEPSDAAILDPGDEERPTAKTAPEGRTHLARSSMRTAMDAYRDHRWTLSDDNLRNPCETMIVPGIPIACRRPDRFVLPPEQTRRARPAAMTGVPYDWGGTDSLGRFDQKIEQGYIAGNIGGTFWPYDARRVTAGVDCSGFVANVWKLGRHVGTTALAEVTERVATLDRMRIGDVLLLPEHHVALYREQVKPDGASLAIRVTEASSRCGMVCDAVYEIDHFHGYAMRRSKTLR